MNRCFLKMENYRNWFGRNPNYEYINKDKVSFIKICRDQIIIYTEGYFGKFWFPKTKYNLDLLESEGFDLE